MPQFLATTQGAEEVLAREVGLRVMTALINDEADQRAGLRHENDESRDSEGVINDLRDGYGVPRNMVSRHVKAAARRHSVVRSAPPGA